MERRIKRKPKEIKSYRKGNWPLPPYAVFRCRPATPWFIPSDGKLSLQMFNEVEVAEDINLPPSPPLSVSPSPGPSPFKRATPVKKNRTKSISISSSSGQFTDSEEEELKIWEMMFKPSKSRTTSGNPGALGDNFLY